MAQTVEFERVPNGNSFEFPCELSTTIILLDGNPELLHLTFGNQDSRLAAWREGTERDVITLPMTSHFNIANNCDGKTLYLVDKSGHTGMMVTFANGSLSTEEATFPVSTDIVSFYRVQDTIYVVTWANTEYHLVSNDLSNPLLRIPPRSSFCFLGNYFIVVSPSAGRSIITIHDLNDTILASINLIHFGWNSIFPVDDRWLIIVGSSRVGILDILTKEVDTFTYGGIVGNVFKCAARKRRNVAELFISTRNIRDGVSFIYKAYLPIKALAVNHIEIIALDEENAALKLENSEAKEKIALLESSVSTLKAVLEEDKKALEEQMAALQKKYSSMLLMMGKK